jgi:hypothetical protein
MQDERAADWLTFASIVLIVAGVMRVFDALWAFRHDDAVPEGLQDAILGESLSTYGWFYLLVAVVLILSGVLIYQRNQLARWIGIGAGALGAISAAFWLPYYPVWSLIYIMMGVFVIYGLAAYGGREETTV